MAYKDIEKKRAYHREYARRKYAESPAMAEKQREYRKSRLGKYAEYQRGYRARNPRETLVNQAKSRAKKFGFPFNISVETLEWPTHCPVLGLELDYAKTKPGQRKIRVSVPTLDRRVNELGYVLGNVFVISHRANRIKSDASLAELKAVVAYMERLEAG